MEHINRFIMQCGEAAQNDALKVQQFHQFFYSGIEEMKLTDLTNLRQRNDGSVAAFIQRFRDVKNWCFSLVLSDQQLAEVAFQGLLSHITEKICFPGVLQHQSDGSQDDRRGQTI